jgi:hypothetical protein
LACKAAFLLFAPVVLPVVRFTVYFFTQFIETMKINFAYRLFSAVFLLLVLSCAKKTDSDPAPTDNTPSYATGWLGGEDFSNVPLTYSSGSFGNVQLPVSVDLTPYLPPIGNQGNYGTCVAWAAGYYAKTATEAIAGRYTTAQLSNLAYHISPRDLFTAIPNGKKGGGCDGTDFLSALNILQSRGAATLSTAPYTNLGDCSQATAPTSWATDAAKHKIAAYRTIDATANAIKQALANKSPVIFGAKTTVEFDGWNTANVLSTGTYGPKSGGHAMAIVGYDDKKGVGGAFRVVNSWGTNWGNKGFVWVDYNYMVSKFNTNKGYYVMTEPASKTQPTTPTTTGVDLEAWVDEDNSTYRDTGRPTSRGAVVNIYNNGRAAATPQKPWTVYYFYYNARDSKDLKVLYTYTFTTKNLAKSTCANSNCDLNIAIPSGGSLSKQLFGNDNGAYIRYDMPTTLNGSYYLVWYVDPEGVLADEDDSDNAFYVTDYPIQFKNGYAARLGANDLSATNFSFKNPLTINSPKGKRSQFNTAIRPDNLNAYSPEEVRLSMQQMKKNGELDKKIKEYVQQHPTPQSVRQAE